MKRMIIMLLLLLTAAVSAHAEYWDSTTARKIVCCDDRPGCQVLQTVMMGSFAAFDPGDHVNVRVFSAAFPRLLAVTEEDFLHFQRAFDLEEDRVKNNYFTALGNCLWADILISPEVSDPGAQQARTILLLFLEPAVQPEQLAQQQAIRAASDENAISLIADHADVPISFVRHLLGAAPLPTD